MASLGTPTNVQILSYGETTVTVRLTYSNKTQITCSVSPSSLNTLLEQLGLSQTSST